jgi:phage FluMu gp28-like protein
MQVVITPPDLTDYQEAILGNQARFTVTAAATKCGKTFSHIWWLFKEAHLGEKGNEFWWVAPVYSQAKIAYNRMKAKIVGVVGYSTNESDLTISTPIGTVIRFKSAEKPDNLYGEDVYAAVFDEYTRAREEAWIALRSTLTATKGKCKFIGNVKGKNNWGYKLAMRAKNGEANYAFFKVTAYDAVKAGVLELAEVEQAKHDLPERAFNELYLAEPAEDGSNPFGYDHIRACIKPMSKEPTAYYGVDLAKKQDWTVIIGLDKDGNQSYFERFQMPWGETRQRIVQVIGKAHALIDSTGVGDPVVEEIAKVCPNVKGINYSAGHRTKQQLMEGLAMSIQSGNIAYEDGIIVDELLSFEFEYSASGNINYSAPSGFTDDCVNALALANRCKLQNPYFKRVFLG